MDLYEDKDGNWTANPAQAKRETDKDGNVVKDKDGNDVLVRLQRKKADKGKPSEINLGNVTPDIVVDGRSQGTPFGRCHHQRSSANNGPLACRPPPPAVSR